MSSHGYEGHPDPASAGRAGVSPRTYAGYVADLKEEYEAQSRFQFGYNTMGKLGITGSERDEQGGKASTRSPRNGLKPA
ncbi:MAG: hypothetical protein ACRCYQ_07080 [Nocardioides sp.]